MEFFCCIGLSRSNMKILESSCIALNTKQKEMKKLLSQNNKVRGLRALGFSTESHRCFRTYSDITLSCTSPADFTKNPSPQNVAPQYTSSNSGKNSLIFLLVPPFMIFIISLGLHFGAAPIYKCTWSCCIASSNISHSLI